MTERWYVACDALLLLASDLPARGELIDRLANAAREGALFTSTITMLECEKIFQKQGGDFRSFFSRLRPAFEAVFDFSERDFLRALELTGTGLSWMSALEASSALHSGMDAIVTSDAKIDSLSGIRRIEFAI